MVHKQVTSKANCNQGRKTADWSHNSTFLMKYKGQGRLILYSTFGTFLIFEMSVVKDDVENNSHLKSVCIHFCFFCSCNSSLYCDVGKWFRVPRYRWSRCGRPGRECSCSGVQWRPGHETSWQGWPGSQALFSFLFSLPVLVFFKLL